MARNPPRKHDEMFYELYEFLETHKVSVYDRLLTAEQRSAEEEDRQRLMKWVYSQISRAFRKDIEPVESRGEDRTQWSSRISDHDLLKQYNKFLLACYDAERPDKEAKNRLINWLRGKGRPKSASALDMALYRAHKKYPALTNTSALVYWLSDPPIDDSEIPF